MNKIFSVNIIFISLILSLLNSNWISLSHNSEAEINSNIQKDIFSEKVQWTENKLSSMTLREKIAQMIITNSDGFSAPVNSTEYNRLSNLIINEKIGGVIFFKGNSLQQAELSNTLQTLSETPLLISADYERGTKMRLDDGSLFPSNMALGATRNPELAYKMGVQIAKECKAIGVHQNYAPVVDINNNSLNPIINVRSYGEDPDLVSSMSEKFIKVDILELLSFAHCHQEFLFMDCCINYLNRFCKKSDADTILEEAKLYDNEYLLDIHKTLTDS